MMSSVTALALNLGGLTTPPSCSKHRRPEEDSARRSWQLGRRVNDDVDCLLFCIAFVRVRKTIKSRGERIRVDVLYDANRSA